MPTDHLPQPLSNHGHFYSAFILTSLLGSCSIAISLTYFLYPVDQEFQDVKSYLVTVYQSFGFLFTVCLMMLCLWFIIKYKEFVCKGLVLVTEKQMKNVHVQLTPNEPVFEQQGDHSHSSSFQIIAFGIGSILFLLTELIKDIFENNTDIMRLTTSSLSPACCMVFIIFLQKYHKVALKNCKCFHYCIGLMLAAEVCTWISITVKPLWDLTSENITDTMYNTSHHDHNDFETGLEVLQCFLQPVFVEFLSISTVCLFGLWKTMHHRLYDQQDSNNTPPINNNSNFKEDAEALLGCGASSSRSHNLESNIPVNTTSDNCNSDETLCGDLNDMASPSINTLPCDLHDGSGTSSETLLQCDHDLIKPRLQQKLDSDKYDKIQTLIIATLSSIIAICFVAPFTLLPPVPIFPVEPDTILKYDFIKTILYSCVGGIYFSTNVQNLLFSFCCHDVWTAEEKKTQRQKGTLISK